MTPAGVIRKRPTGTLSNRPRSFSSDARSASSACRRLVMSSIIISAVDGRPLRSFTADIVTRPQMSAASRALLELVVVDLARHQPLEVRALGGRVVLVGEVAE